MNCPFHSTISEDREQPQENTTLEAIKVLAPYFLKILGKKISQTSVWNLSLQELIQLAVESEDQMRVEISRKYSDIPFRWNTLTHIPAPSCFEEEVLQKYHLACKLSWKRMLWLSLPDFIAGTSFIFRLFYTAENLLQQQWKANCMTEVMHHPKTLAFLRRYMTVWKQRLSLIVWELYWLSWVEEFEFEHIYTPLAERFFFIGQDSRWNFLTEDELLQSVRQRVSQKTKTVPFSACPVFWTVMFSELYETLFEIYFFARGMSNSHSIS